MLCISALSACQSMTAVNHIPVSDSSGPVSLTVFLDGTANNESSHTNVSKLHNLVTLQNTPFIRSSYIKGVGTDGRVLGMALGWGIGHDVREAYLFLAENYHHERGDNIYLFGFSRGAFAARILAAMLYVAGLPDLSSIPQKQKYAYIEAIYNAYKGIKSEDERREAVKAVLGRDPVPVDVKFMGLWDTVEALGIPDYEENWRDPNQRYGDQLCNIEKAAHAVAIDDSRARIFTPVLLTNPDLTRTCPWIVIDDVVDEVWFAGAHSDVGGGYDDTHISGVSLNWMLNQIEAYRLTPDNTQVFADIKDKTHDPESGLWGLVYRKQNRNLAAYSRYSGYNNNLLKVHHSVIERLRHIAPAPFEFQWHKEDAFASCFETVNGGLRYKTESGCLSLVK
ncbi:hypothetical protein A8L45_17530 [Veronia pacifica]|uniref:T6SS Phospholipase effector Tle1-like catalytic domain-containing protein n=2 Tax=Veronia pacifica TaxID=1080227 RepID=A0A1C3EDI8_9GAMM|nr:hypothetical protein A8L45_17530 [Veronia pacifica]